MMALQTVTMPLTMAMKQLVMAETRELNWGVVLGFLCQLLLLARRVRCEGLLTHDATAPIVTFGPLATGLLGLVWCRYVRWATLLS